MPRLDGLRRIAASVLIIFCALWGERRHDQAQRWVDRGHRLQAWRDRTKPQMRACGERS